MLLVALVDLSPAGIGHGGGGEQEAGRRDGLRRDVRGRSAPRRARRPCGPIPAPRSRSDAICAQAAIVCPLYASPRICLPSSNCGGSPIYTGEGSLVNVRKRGSSTVLARLPIVEGHFKIRLAPGSTSSIRTWRKNSAGRPNRDGQGDGEASRPGAGDAERNEPLRRPRGRGLESWFLGRDGGVRGRCGRPSCVPGVSWRPWQAVAATRRPGREGLCREEGTGTARSRTSVTVPCGPPG